VAFFYFFNSLIIYVACQIRVDLVKIGQKDQS